MIFLIDLEFSKHLILHNLENPKKEPLQKVKEKVDEDGTVYEWDEVQKAWFPKVTQDFLASYQASYGSMREPITAPDGTTFEWDEEKKKYFDKDSNPIPEEGFLHENVRYTYSTENNHWLADGKPIATQQQVK